MGKSLASAKDALRSEYRVLSTMFGVRAARQQILGALIIALLILALLLVRFGRLIHWSAR